MPERSSVQNPMLDYAGEIGWQYVSPAVALAWRGGDSGLYFAEILSAALMLHNPGVVDTDRAADIIRRLNLIDPGIAGNRDALRWLRGEQSVYVSMEDR